MLIWSLTYPGHGGDCLWLPVPEQGLLVHPVPELVGKVPVEVHTLGILTPSTTRRHVTTVTLLNKSYR